MWESISDWFGNLFGQKDPLAQGQPPSDPVAGLERQLQSIQTFWQNRPDEAMQVAASQEALAAFSELVSAAGPGGDQTAPTLVQALFQDPTGRKVMSEVAAELGETPLVSQFLNQHTLDFRPDEKGWLFTVLAALDGKRRNQFVSLAEQYLRKNPLTGGEDVRDGFMTWAAQKGRALQQEQYAQKGVLGTIGEIFATPYRVVNQGLSWLWANTADPGQAEWRQHLTLGQNIALTVGADPSDDHWDTLSGGIDLVSNLLDPTIIASKISKGVRLAQVVPRLDEGLGWLGRITSATARANLPTGAGSFTTRLAYSTFSKTFDELAATPSFQNRIVGVIAGLDSPAQIIERFPQFKKSELLTTYLARETDPTTITNMLRDAVTMGRAKPELTRAVAAELASSREAKQRIVDGLVRSGRVSVDDWTDIAEQAPREIVEFGGRRSFTLRNGVASLEPPAEGDQVVGFLKGARILDLSDEAGRLTHADWLENSGIAFRDKDNFVSILRGGGTINGADPRLARLADAAEADAIRMGPTEFLTFGQKNQIRGRFFEQGMVPIVDTPEYLAADRRYRRAAQHYDELVHQRNITSQIVVDLPDKGLRASTIQAAKVKARSSNFWPVRKAMLAARPQVPHAIELTSPAETVEQLDRTLRALRVPRERILQYKDEVLAAVTPDERFDAVFNVLQKAGEDIGNGHLSWRWAEFFESNEGVRAYTRLRGQPVHTRMSTRSGVVHERPLFPFEQAQSIPLPNEGLFEGARRWRQAGKLPGQVLRGFTPGTRRRRDQLARMFQQRAAQTGAQLEYDEALELAYSHIASKTRDEFGNLFTPLDGRGLINRAMRLPHKLYDPATRIFKIAQLIGRPISWTSRVLLEGEFRAAFAGMTSIFSNPIRWSSGVYDGMLLNRHRHLANRNRDWATQTLALIRKDLPADGAAAVAKISETIPKFGAFIADQNIDPSDIRAVSLVLDRMVGSVASYGERVTALSGAKLPGLRQAIMRSHALERVGTTARKMGLDPSAFDWVDDAEEIMQRGMINLVVEAAGPSTREATWLAGQMTPTSLHNYGTVYGTRLVNVAEDEIGKWALRRIAARMDGTGISDLDGAALVADRAAWEKVRGIAAELADNQGKVFADQRALAENYLSTVEETVDELIVPIAQLAGGGPASRGQVADALAHRREMTVGDLTLPSWNARSPAALRDFGVGMTTGHPELPMPPAITARIDGRFLRDPRWSKRATNAMLQFFGEELEQSVARRPAYIHLRQRWYDYYTRLGATQEAAAEAARMKAGGMINRVMFNMRESPAIFGKLERTFPFITAQFEVLKSWAYTLPSVEGGLIFGGPSMVRRVDRLLDGLVETGLVRVDPEYDTDGNLARRNFRLAFEENPDTNNMLGDFLSKYGHVVASTPQRIIGQLTSIVNDENFETPDRIEYGVGSPYEPNSHGLMGVSQFSLGLNPFVGLPLAEALRRSNFAGDFKTDVTGEGETLAAFANRLGVDLGQLTVMNRAILEQAVGSATVAELYAGRLTAEQMTLPAGVGLALPGSSVFDTLVEPALYPFGVHEGGAGFLFELAPSWAALALRGAGLWADLYTLDPDDRQGLVDIFLTPASRSQVNGQVLEALRHLEATEGLLTSAQKERTEFSVWLEGLKAEGLITFRETGQPVLLDPTVPEAEEFNLRWSRIRDMDATIMSRANRIAGFNLLTRGISGAFAAANPTFWYDEQKAADTYYASRSFTDARIRGAAAITSAEIPEIDRAADIDSFLQLAEAWWNDPTGDASKAEFRRQYPYMMPYLTPKTYWAGEDGQGGPPPEVRSLEQTMRDIQAGRRQPLEPEVWMQRAIRSSLVAEREIEIRDQFGADPGKAMQAIVGDYNSYRQITDRYDEEFAAIDLIDSELYEGSYQRWRQRNSQDTLAETIREDIFTNLEAIDDIVELLPSFDMPRDERQTVTTQLKEMARVYRDLIDQATSNDEQFQNPREVMVAKYFSEVVAPYYGTLAAMYEQVDAVRDTEDQQRLRLAIRDWQNSVTGTTAEVAGLTVPNAQEWHWNSLNEEGRKERLEKWSKDPLAWLPLFQVNKLVDATPGLRQYMPSAADDMRVYLEAENAKADVADLFEQGQITSGQRTKLNRAIDESLQNDLLNSGRTGEVIWEQLYPIQRMHLAGQLPPSLHPYVGAVNSIRSLLQANDVGPTSQAGRHMFTLLAQKVLEDGQRNPVVLSDFFGVLDRVWNESTWDRGFARLFMGDNFGEL